MVSLVGPGGVGKTRLALRAATDLTRGFRDGAYLITLAEARDPSAVAGAAVAALGLRDQDPGGTVGLLLGFLADKELLLLVDNCEHVLDPAAHLVSAVLEAAPGVRVLATSREPLGVPGEHLLAVPPLELPGPDGSEALDRLRQNEAVALFTDRAGAASGDFELSATNRAAVVGLCRRLDGLPLALELAAVRTRVLSVEQILSHLDDRFALLTGGGPAALPRHQTLRTAIDWSHDLLGHDERVLLRRLSAFAGRFALEDVQGVCTSDEVPTGRILDLVASLVDKSLVTKSDEGAVACYRLHETMREYAALKLREAGEADLLAERLTGYFLARCRRDAPTARFHLVEWLGWLDLEIDNVRAVLADRLARQDHRSGLELVGWLAWFWVTRATNEGVSRLDQLLTLDPGDSPVHAGASFMRGFLACLRADPDSARPALDRAVSAARAGGLDRLLVESLSMASFAASMAGDRASAAHLLEQTRLAEASLDDPVARAARLQAEALDSFFGGDLGSFRAFSAEMERLSRTTGDLYTLEVALMNQGFAALTGAEPAAAGPLLGEALRVAQRLDDRVVQFYLVGGLGCLAAGAGDVRLAAQLLGAYERLRAETGAVPNAILTPLLGPVYRDTRDALGTTCFEAEVRAGAARARDDAIGFALGDPTSNRAAGRDGHAPLAAREWEVALLVAQGLTNRLIGTRLFISERTVENHIHNTMDKLGFGSRTQIAAWVAERGR